MNAAATDPVKRALSSHGAPRNSQTEGDADSKYMRGIKGREETSGEDG